MPKRLTFSDGQCGLSMARLELFSVVSAGMVERIQSQTQC